MKKVIFWCISGITLTIVMLVGIGLYKDSIQTGTLKTFSGSVTDIFQYEGACKVVEINEDSYLNVECPADPGRPRLFGSDQLFNGDYSKGVAVGDKVAVKATYTGKAGDYKGYTLESNGKNTYLRVNN